MRLGLGSHFMVVLAQIYWTNEVKGFAGKAYQKCSGRNSGIKRKKPLDNLGEYAMN